MGIVHGTGWCGQGDITILCNNAMTEPKWGKARTSMPNVYLAENNMLYTFEPASITCKACKELKHAGTSTT